MAKTECICLDGEVCRINTVAKTVLEAYPGKGDIQVNGTCILRADLKRLTTFPPLGALKIDGEFVCTRFNKCTARGDIMSKLIALAKI